MPSIAFLLWSMFITWVQMRCQIPYVEATSIALQKSTWRMYLNIYIPPPPHIEKQITPKRLLNYVPHWKFIHNGGFGDGVMHTHILCDHSMMFFTQLHFVILKCYEVWSSWWRWCRVIYYEKAKIKYVGITPPQCSTISSHYIQGIVYVEILKHQVTWRLQTLWHQSRNYIIY